MPCASSRATAGGCSVTTSSTPSPGRWRHRDGLVEPPIRLGAIGYADDGSMVVPRSGARAARSCWRSTCARARRSWRRPPRRTCRCTPPTVGRLRAPALVRPARERHRPLKRRRRPSADAIPRPLPPPPPLPPVAAAPVPPVLDSTGPADASWARPVAAAGRGEDPVPTTFGIVAMGLMLVGTIAGLVIWGLQITRRMASKRARGSTPMHRSTRTPPPRRTCGRPTATTWPSLRRARRCAGSTTSSCPGRPRRRACRGT